MRRALLDLTLAHRSPPLWARDRTFDCALNLGNARWRYAEPVSHQGQRFGRRQTEERPQTIRAVGEPWPRSLSSVQCTVKQFPPGFGPWPGKETGLPGPDRRQLAGRDESHTKRPTASARHPRSGTAPPPRTTPLYGVLDQVENLNDPSYPTQPRTSDSRTRTSSLPSRSTLVVPYFS